MSSQTSLILEHLRVILGNDSSQDIVNYLSGMKSEEDFDEFMENIVDRDNKHHITACEFIRSVLFQKKQVNRHKGNKAGSFKRSDKDIARESVEAGTSNQKTQQKGKKKFQDLKSFKEKKKEKVGRQSCGCDGQEHDFMNNCLNCGRIHCVEEGPGPCFFCGEPMTLMGEENLNGNRKQKGNANMLRHRENKVFDDDKDYFKLNHTTTSKDSSRSRVIALDFAARKVIESSEEDEKIKKKLLSDAMIHLKNVDKMFRNLQQNSEMRVIQKTQNDLVDLLVQMRHKKPVGSEDIGEEDSSMPVIDYNTKVLDEDLMINTDYGLCLSLHQPYASLLVAGVKKHEGRTWPTNHRGRLWIAAAKKQPDEDDIATVEEFYRNYYDDPALKFPKEYPTGCLLGCVFLEDCLDQETYSKMYPNGESDFPFVFICSNPIILPIFYPISGKHKIYALEKDLHKVAKMSLQYATYVK